MTLNKKQIEAIPKTKEDNAPFIFVDDNKQGIPKEKDLGKQVIVDLTTKESGLYDDLRKKGYSDDFIKKFWG